MHPHRPIVHLASAGLLIPSSALAGRRQLVNYLDSGFELNLKPGQIAQTIDTGIRIRLPLDLPAGQFPLRIAVHDLAAGRAGSLEIPVTVAAK